MSSSKGLDTSSSLAARAETQKKTKRKSHKSSQVVAQRSSSHHKTYFTQDCLAFAKRLLRLFLVEPRFPLGELVSAAGFVPPSAVSGSFVSSAELFSADSGSLLSFAAAPFSSSLSIIFPFVLSLLYPQAINRPNTKAVSGVLRDQQRPRSKEGGLERSLEGLARHRHVPS